MRASKRKVVQIQEAEESAVTMEQALNGFLEYKKREGKGPKTLRDIKHTVEQYYKWMECSFGEERDFGRFLTLKERRAPGAPSGTSACTIEENPSLASSTRDKRIIWCNAFWRWCCAEGFLKTNPAEGFKTKGVPRLPSAPKTDAVKQLMEKIYECAMANDAPWHVVRNAALMAVQLASGSRAGDLLGVRYNDVVRRTLDRRIRYSIIIRGEEEKTGKTRLLTGLDSKQVVKLLDKVLSMWRAYANADAGGKPLPGTDDGQFWPTTAPIFCSQDGTRLKDVKAISAYLRKCAVELGVHDEWNNRKNGGITGLHDLRRYFATSYVQQQYAQNGNVNLLALGGMLGHSNLNTTRKYIDSVVSQRLIEETSADELPISNIFGSGGSHQTAEPRKRAPRKFRDIA